MAQVFVFDPISKLVLMRPFIFLYAVLIMPPMRGWQYLLLAMVMGLCYDLFPPTPGIHASAAVLLAYVRDPLIRAFKRDEADYYSPHITYLGLSRFFFFALIISFGYHTLVEILSVFTFSNFFLTLERIVISTAASAVLIYLLDIILFYRGRLSE
jgi:rod shape-determining protein MreD